MRLAKVLGDSFGAGAGVGVPLALVQWVTFGLLPVDWRGVDMCLLCSLLIVFVNVQRTPYVRTLIV